MTRTIPHKDLKEMQTHGNYKDYVAEEGLEIVELMDADGHHMKHQLHRLLRKLNKKKKGQQHKNTKKTTTTIPKDKTVVGRLGGCQNKMGSKEKELGGGEDEEQKITPNNEKKQTKRLGGRAARAAWGEKINKK